MIRLVPRPVMFGFLNGLAIMILMSQFVHFKTIGEGGIAEWMSGSQLYVMVGLALASMAIIYFLPKITERYAKAGKKAHLRHLSEDSRRLLNKADAIIEVNHFEDPVYKVAVDKV